MRALPLALVLVSLTLAGCIGAGPADTGEGQDWPTITDPQDLSYDTDSGMHVHDYWGGKDTLEILDQTYTISFQNDGDERTRWEFPFIPDDGVVVPQGTASLNVTVDWEDRDDDEPLEEPNSYGDVELWVKPADQANAALVEDELSRGETVHVPLDYADADLPHQVVSAWDFEVHVRGSQEDYNQFHGTITVQVQAHRGLELRPFPPHPDHWGERTEFTLIDHSDSFDRRNNPCPPMCGFDGQQIEHVRPPNGTIVPLGTQRVDVTLTFDNEEPVGDLRLYYHAADTRQFQWLEPDEAEDGEKRYVIPVNATMADTPYAEASQWVFYVNAPSDWTEEAGTFDGTYTLEATVHKE